MMKNVLRIIFSGEQWKFLRRRVMGILYVFKSLFWRQSKEQVCTGKGDLDEVIGMPLIQYQNGLFFGLCVYT